jgi:hypothetical protein
MDAYDICTNVGGKNLAEVFEIYGRGRELFRPPAYALDRAATRTGSLSIFQRSKFTKMIGVKNRITTGIPWAQSLTNWLIYQIQNIVMGQFALITPVYR